MFLVSLKCIRGYIITMKLRRIVAAALTAVSLSALAAEPSLTGTWSGHRERLGKVNGYASGVSTLIITEQNGWTFKGSLTRIYSTGDITEPFWGAFSPGGRMIFAGDEEGQSSFDLVDENTLDYCYTESGNEAEAVCARLIRQK